MSCFLLEPSSSLPSSSASSSSSAFANCKRACAWTAATASAEPPIRYNKSPNRCTELWRIRHFESVRPFSRTGKSLSVCKMACCSTKTCPARKETSRTSSDSSDKPLIMIGNSRSINGELSSAPKQGGKNTNTHTTPSRTNEDASFATQKMFSSRTMFVYSSPSAQMTSTKPWAPPDLSTGEVLTLDVSRSHCNNSVKFGKPSPSPSVRVPRAFAAVERTPGIGSTRTFWRTGIRSFTYGRTAFGSEIIEHILPTIRAAFFFVSVDLSFKPRSNTGTINAKDGASTM
mmetsp:Transcript_19291/g.32226  ORF Transcript_19291/g.32226 Transcript_19291/m.32226 type:complete len:287 (-) Transcript_19291:5756-6616(-)